MKTKRNDIAGLLRQAFKESGRSIKSVADQAGVTYSSAHRFFTVGADVQASTLDRVANALCLDLTLTTRGGC